MMDKSLLARNTTAHVNRIMTQTTMVPIKLYNKINQPQTHQPKQQPKRVNSNSYHKGYHSFKSKTKSRTTRTTTTNQMSLIVARKHLFFIILLSVVVHHVHSFDMTTVNSNTMLLGKSTTRYSQLLSTNGQMTVNDKNVENTDDTFRPFIPKDLELVSRNVFTPSGQFHVFQPIDTDLRATVAKEHRSYKVNKMSESLFTPPASTTTTTSSPVHKETQKLTKKQKKDVNLSSQKSRHANNNPNIDIDIQRNEVSKQDEFTSDLKSLEDLLTEYVTNFFEKGEYKPIPGLLVELQHNHSVPLTNGQKQNTRNVRHIPATGAKISVDVPRTMATGRLLFLTGLKKVLWPVFMGLQVLKSLLIAMFIPALIGSFTKLLGKGISTGSAPLFIRPMDPPQELDFRDNSLNFEDDNKFLPSDDGNKDNGPYAYNQADASQMQNQYAYNPASAGINSLAFTRLGMNERQHQLMQDSYMSALQSIGSASFKNSGSLSSSSSGLLAPMTANKPPPTTNVNTFQQFQKVRDSSLLLSNYDPFYSPLLSRLDSVFGQLKINADKEVCREKLICLMYANPAKYAPYSNLVSAQLSRELNELRKPTSDNPDILRFFKYMRAAKDGQDGVDCEKTFDKCAEFKDFENPAMVSTYHDINKLVQARKLT